MSTAGPWHYEGHYILTDSEPQEIICERVSEANRGLIASAPGLQATIETLADLVEWLLNDDSREAREAAKSMLRVLGRYP